MCSSGKRGTNNLHNQITFLAALGSHTTQNFDGFAAGTVITNQLSGITSVTTDGNHGSTQAQIGSIAGLPFPMTAGLPTSSGDRFLSSELAAPVFATARLIFNLSSDETGVGLFVVDGGPLGNFVISLFEGATLVGTATFGPQTLPNSFVGVISTIPFNLVNVGSASANDSWGIDDLTIGPTGASAVPEPGSLALLGAGVLLVAAKRLAKRS